MNDSFTRGGFGDGAPSESEVRAMLANPFIRGQLESLLNDPETLREMFENNPALAGVLDANPQMREALRDPETLRQMFNVATNPSLMQEAMRSNDRAMSNISSHPEGFNALRRMYETMQEPLDSMGADANRAPDVGTPGTPADGPLPNPWASPAPAVRTPTAQTPPNFGARGGAFGGAFGGGFDGGFDGGLGGASDDGAHMGRLAEMIDNPQIQQAMSSMLSNPQALEAMLNMNPRMRQMVDANPQMRQMLQNPEAMRAMMNPENLRAMAQMQQAMRTLGGDGGFGNVFGGTFAAPPAPQGPPEEIYATQLTQLNSMGFLDPQENVRALRATGGNVHAAVDRLLSNGFS